MKQEINNTKEAMEECLNLWRAIRDSAIHGALEKDEVEAYTTTGPEIHKTYWIEIIKQRMVRKYEWLHDCPLCEFFKKNNACPLSDEEDEDLHTCGAGCFGYRYQEEMSLEDIEYFISILEEKDRFYRKQGVY